MRIAELFEKKGFFPNTFENVEFFDFEVILEGNNFENVNRVSIEKGVCFDQKNVLHVKETVPVLPIGKHIIKLGVLFNQQVLFRRPIY